MAMINKKRKIFPNIDIDKNISHVKNIYKIERKDNIVLIYDRELDFIKKSENEYFLNYDEFEYFFKVNPEKNNISIRKKWRNKENELNLDLSMLLALKNNLDKYPDSNETAIIEKESGKRFVLRIQNKFFVFEIRMPNNKLENLFSIHKSVLSSFIFDILYNDNTQDWELVNNRIIFRKKRRGSDDWF